MKAVLVIEMPDEYADRYNVENMYVWNLVVQDKQGYEMFDLTTDKPSHLRPLSQEREVNMMKQNEYEVALNEGWNACLYEITGETE